MSTWAIVSLISAIAAVSIALGLQWSAARFASRFRDDREQVLREFKLRTASTPETVLTEQDIEPLPPPVQKYIRITGFLGKPKIQNFQVRFSGRMRGKEQNYFQFESEQINRIDAPTRLFFMKAKMFGLPLLGYHRFENAHASMDIRPFGLFSVVHFDGSEMNKTETVTFLNDLCLLAPGALVDKRIRWDKVEERSARATLIINEISVQAILHFDESGRLVNFESNDRYEVNSGQWLRFSTPIHQYGEYKGHRLPAKADAVWDYPDGPFVYGQFETAKVEYNVSL